MAFCSYLFRYYSPKELEGRGVKHVKIRTEGHVVPSEGVVQQFYRFFENLPKKDFVHIYEHIKMQTVRDGSKNLFTESVFFRT